MIQRPNLHCWTFGHSVNCIQRTYQREFPHKLPAKFLKNRHGAKAEAKRGHKGPQKGPGSIALRPFPST
jgi:hypothetical protein